MILTTMTLHSAVTGLPTELVSIKIVNTGTGSKTRGNYWYEIRGKRRRLLKSGEVANWPRLHKSPLALLQKVINSAYPKEAS